MAYQLNITASCVIRDHQVFKNQQLVFGNKEVAAHDLLVAAYRHFDGSYPKFFKMDNLCRLGWLAAEVLLTGSFDKDKYQPQQRAIVLSNTNSSIDADVKYFESTNDIPSPALFVYTLPNIVIGEISIRHSFKGENAFFISEKFDPDLLERYVGNLFNNDVIQVCICGWVELVGEQYLCMLFLVEKQEKEMAHSIPGSGSSVMPFKQENLNFIYQLYNG